MSNYENALYSNIIVINFHFIAGKLFNYFSKYLLLFLFRDEYINKHQELIKFKCLMNKI